MLQDRVVGQPAAVKCVVRCLKRYHAGMRDEKRPVGCFLFAGKYLSYVHMSFWGNASHMLKNKCVRYDQVLLELEKRNCANSSQGNITQASPI